MRNVLLLLSTLLALAAFAQTAAPTLAELQREERAASVAPPAPLEPVDPASLGYRTQADLDAAVRRLLKLSSTRRFVVVWERDRQHVSIIVEPTSGTP
ncbi:MAG: hypothetical protein ACOZQL_20415 [Myxococcota bacterium]